MIWFVWTLRKSQTLLDWNGVFGGISGRGMGVGRRVDEDVENSKLQLEPDDEKRIARCLESSVKSNLSKNANTTVDCKTKYTEY